MRLEITQRADLAVRALVLVLDVVEQVDGPTDNS